MAEYVAVAHSGIAEQVAVTHNGERTVVGVRAGSGGVPAGFVQVLIWSGSAWLTRTGDDPSAIASKLYVRTPTDPIPTTETGDLVATTS